MPSDPKNNRPRQHLTDEEYRAQHAERAKRRQKKRNQRLILLGAFALAAILFVVCIIMIVNALFKKPGTDAPSAATTSSESVPSVPSVSVPPPKPVAPDPDLWSLKIVNVNAPLGPDFAPEFTAFTTAGHNFDTRAVDQIKQMIADCNAASDSHDLQVFSGYRSYRYQSAQFNEKVVAYQKANPGTSAEVAQAAVAQTYDRPGTSEHQLGLAVDFLTATVNTLSDGFASTSEFQWLTEHAHEYGFVLRYPADKTAITGVIYKPWHWRFVGVNEAVIMRDAGICLEEYVGGTGESETPSAPDEGGGSAAGSDAGGSAAE